MDVCIPINFAPQIAIFQSQTFIGFTDYYVYYPERRKNIPFLSVSYSSTSCGLPSIMWQLSMDNKHFLYIVLFRAPTELSLSANRLSDDQKGEGWKG